MEQQPQSPILIGISACLLGEQVRFDGGHKRSAFCEQTLGPFVRYVPVCPEMAIGLGTPRPAIRLVKRPSGIHIEASDGRFDVTEAMLAFSEQKVAEFSSLSGYILCAKSPSCGMERVRLYGEAGGAKEGVGLYARALMQRWPLLPVEEDGRLNDPHLRENFVLRVFAYHDWQCQSQAGMNRGRLIAFHSRYKYLLLAHDPGAYKDLGRYLANMSAWPLEHVLTRYISGLMRALQQRASRKNHTNVLQHLQGYFKRQLSREQKAELQDAIDGYRRGNLPLLVPLTLLKHYQREYPNAYLAEQVYFSPYPAELALRYGL